MCLFISWHSGRKANSLTLPIDLCKQDLYCQHSFSSVTCKPVYLFSVLHVEYGPSITLLFLGMTSSDALPCTGAIACRCPAGSYSPLDVSFPSGQKGRVDRTISLFRQHNSWVASSPKKWNLFVVSLSEPFSLAEVVQRGITPHGNGCEIQGAAHIRAEVRFHHASQQPRRHAGEILFARQWPVSRTWSAPVHVVWYERAL